MSETVIRPQIVTVTLSAVGLQGPSGTFDGFSVDGGSAVTTFLATQNINCGNAV